MQNTFKKTVSAVLATSVFAGMIVVAPGALAATGTSIQVNAQTYNKLDAEGQKLAKKEYTKSKVTFTQADLSASGASLGGTADVSGESLPFSLTGELTKSENSSDLIIGNLTDSTGNFEVVYLGLDRKAETNVMVDKSKLNVANGKKTVFKLYLMKKDTRDFVSVELVNPSFVDEEALFAGVNNLKVAKHKDEFWYLKVLKPVNVEATDVTSKLLLQGKQTQPEGVIEPEVIKTTTSDWNYRITYNVSGGLIYEDFVVRHYMDGPTAFSTDGSFFNTKVNVKSEKTWSYDYPSMNSSQTGTELGWYDKTKIDAYTDPGDAIRSVAWDGTYYKSGGISIEARFSYSALGTNLGFTATYTSGQTYTAETMKVFDNSGTNKVRQAGTFWAAGHLLKDVGHTFDNSWQVGNFSSPGTNKFFHVRFTYDISNGQDYTWGGTYSRDVSLGYSNY